MNDFHDNWTTDRIPQWLPHVQHLVDRECAVLEIGCYEGRTSAWLMEHVLQHPASVLVCLDPFCVNEDFKDPRGEKYADYLPRFVANTAQWRDRIHILQSRSQLVRADTVLNLVAHPFDLIYIDGSHETADVLSDARIAYQLSRPGTRIAFDDFGWASVRDGIQLWLADTPRPDLRVVFDNYQIMVEVL